MVHNVGTTAEIEEERRPLYVAMTRAKDNQHIVVPQRFFTHGQNAQSDRHVSASRTRFIPASLLQLLEHDMAHRRRRIVRPAGCTYGAGRCRRAHARHVELRTADVPPGMPIGLTRMVSAHTDDTANSHGQTASTEEVASSPGRQRKIIHVDMDAFYASVEQRDNPELRGKPVAVGGSRERGVVAAASYEARKFGVRSAMPSVTAKRNCPDLIFVKPRFDVYKAVSLQVRAVFAEHTPLIEPLSLDEAYLDVTESLQGIASATEIAEAIRAKIKAETNLTASAGVSYNKFLAKLASDYRKPNGLYVITPKMGADFVVDLPVSKFHGIGPATTARMNGFGIHTGADLRAQSLDFLQRHFGKAGTFYYWISRGVDERPVRADRVRKSVGAENTFFTDLFTLSEACDALPPIIEKVWRHCEATGTRGRTVTLKVKFADFHQITRSLTCDTPVATQAALKQISYALLEPVFPVQQGIRLLGVTLSSLAHDLPQDVAQLKLSL